MAGGQGGPEGIARGFFARPTIFSQVSNIRMTIAREEIFGPVLSILPYRDEDEAVAIANDTPYGLSGYVSAADPAMRPRGGPPPAHRQRAHQRRADRHGGALRRLQAVRPRPRMGRLGHRRSSSR